MSIIWYTDRNGCYTVKDYDEYLKEAREFLRMEHVKHKTTLRNNPQIWRIAKYLSDNISNYIFREYPHPDALDNDWEQPFEETCEEYRNYHYDVAVLLLAKLARNEFTGEDNHE